MVGWALNVHRLISLTWIWSTCWILLLVIQKEKIPELKLTATGYSFGAMHCQGKIDIVIWHAQSVNKRTCQFRFFLTLQLLDIHYLLKMTVWLFHNVTLWKSSLLTKYMAFVFTSVFVRLCGFCGECVRGCLCMCGWVWTCVSVAELTKNEIKRFI